MNESILNRTVSPDPAVSERVVDAFCEHANLPRPDFFTADQVVELLRALGYAVTPGTLKEFARKRYVSEPVSGVWNDMFVHALAVALEARRRWRPYPNPVHDGDKTFARLEIERAEADGRRYWDEQRELLESRSLEDLLILVTESDDRRFREVYYETILAKMADLGFVEE